jgi:hypothetical protein
MPVRDFKSEYYYPAERGKHGTLILWEFKEGWLTPLTPEIKDVPQELKVQFEKLKEELKKQNIVNFEFSEEMYRSLMIKAVDDTDAEWFINTIQRIESQYVSGWRDFLSKYGGHLLVAIVAVCLLVGWIVWIKESPEWAGQCISAGVEAAKNTYLQQLANKTTAFAGIPPG